MPRYIAKQKKKQTSHATKRNHETWYNSKYPFWYTPIKNLDAKHLSKAEPHTQMPETIDNLIVFKDAIYMNSHYNI